MSISQCNVLHDDYPMLFFLPLGSVIVEFDLVGDFNKITFIRNKIIDALNATQFQFVYNGQTITADNILWEDGAEIVKPKDPYIATTAVPDPDEVSDVTLMSTYT